MTDKELMELAAKAVGLDLIYCPAWKCMAKELHGLEGSYFDVYSCWNPLTDDGDALRLAVKLNMGISIPVMAATHARVDVITFRNSGVNVIEACKDDPCAATRRAIVRVAAEIGRNK